MTILDNPFRLTGKTVLVTGASSGIGRCVSTLCAAMGAHLIICGRNKERLQGVLESLQGEGHTSFLGDLDTEAARGELLQQLPRLDGAVFCAGTLVSTPVRFLTREVEQRVFETNYFSTTALASALVAAKRLNKGASLVFLSSVAAALSAEPGNAAYGASKAALASFARVLALELASRAIRVNCVTPGMVRTPFLQHFEADEEELLENEKKYPLGFADPEDVAAAVCYLLGDGARRVTGASLLIDGGLTLN